MEWGISLLNIFFINLILSGDNAIVIAMASRNVPKHQQKHAIFLGTVFAIILRILLTFGAVYLLQIPLLQTIGGVLLLWIAYKLLLNRSHKPEHHAGTTLGGVIQTILIADFIMSMDNVIAVASLADGDFYLLFIGLAISIPIIIYGSQLIMGFLKEYPILIYVGSSILSWAAGSMIVSDPFQKDYLTLLPHIDKIIPGTLALLIPLIAKFKNRGQSG